MRCLKTTTAIADRRVVRDNCFENHICNLPLVLGFIKTNFAKRSFNFGMFNLHDYSAVLPEFCNVSQVICEDVVVVVDSELWFRSFSTHFGNEIINRSEYRQTLHLLRNAGLVVFRDPRTLPKHPITSRVLVAGMMGEDKKDGTLRFLLEHRPLNVIEDLLVGTPFPYKISCN